MISNTIYNKSKVPGKICAVFWPTLFIIIISIHRPRITAEIAH